MNEPSDPIRVLLVDDHQMFIDSLDRLLADEPDLDVVGSVVNGEQARERITVDPPDVVVLDYQLPDGTGAEITRWINEHHSHTHVVMVTGNASLPTVRDSLQAGSTAVVAKDRAASELVAAIRSAARGESTVAVPMMALLAADDTSTEIGLTPRELEVLQLLGTGASTDDIAATLFVSRNTVRSHVQRVLGKLGARSKLEAVVMARERGLLI